MRDDDLRRAELYLKLADRASARFESRRSMEWQVNLALWGALAVGAGVVVSARNWSPGCWQVVGVAFACILLFCCYVLFWIPYLDRSFKRESKTSHFWETWAQKAMGLKKPAQPEWLRPGTDDMDRDKNWPSAFDEMPEEAQDTTNANSVVQNAPAQSFLKSARERIELYCTRHWKEFQRFWKFRHAVQELQILATFAFCCLFVGAMASKALYSPAAPIVRQSIDIEDATAEGIQRR